MWGGEPHSSVSTTGIITHIFAVNRWISSRFNVLSSFVIGCVAFISVFSYMDAAIAGFALSFASTITMDLLFMVRRFVGLEQAMVRCRSHIQAPPDIDRFPRSPSSELRNTRNWNVSLPSSWSPDPPHLGPPPDGLNARTLSFAIRYAAAVPAVRGE